MSTPAVSPSWPVPPTERARLRELRSLDVLDTPSEEPYDGLVEIAAALFETPMAFLSLVAEDVQWFKAKVGVEVCGTGRDIAFCAHAILGTRAMVVEDATLDPRFRDNPLVTGEPGIRFYAGAPLVTSAGESVGTLCVADTKPRRFAPERLRLLERLARQAVRLLEAQRLANDLSGAFSR